MSYVNQRLPTCVALGFSGGPEWSTLIVPLENGREQRNAQWLYPKHKFTAEYLNFQANERDDVLKFFHAMRGQLHCFLFKDWNDYKAELEPLSVSVGTSTPVQLTKSYTVGSETATRLIQAPRTGIVTYNDIAVSGSLDHETGLFTPSAPWAAHDYVWTGEFDLWVRFATDFNAFTVGNKNAHTADIELIEVRR